MTMTHIHPALGPVLHAAGLRLALPEGQACRTCAEWLPTKKADAGTGLRLGKCGSAVHADWYARQPMPKTLETDSCVAGYKPGRAGEE